MQLQGYVKPINKSKTDFGDMFTFSYVNTLGKYHTVDGQTRSGKPGILGASGRWGRISGH